jgi:hypothetical protein
MDPAATDNRALTTKERFMSAQPPKPPTTATSVAKPAAAATLAATPPATTAATAAAAAATPAAALTTTIPPGVVVPPTTTPPVSLTTANSPYSGTQVQPVTVPNTSGTVTFQLVVYDNFNTPSAPVTATVTIQGAPVASLTATPGIVGPGNTITLSAGAKTAGTISSYQYSLVPPTAVPGAPAVTVT